MYYLQELERIKDGLIQKRNDCYEELQQLPEGFLYSYISADGKRYYFERLPKEGNRKKARRTGVSKNPEKLSALIRKEYITSAIDILGSNIHAVCSAIERYEPCDEGQVMGPFIADHPDKAHMVYRSAYAGDGKWSSDYHSSENLYESNLKATSSEGIKMRSMAEIAIASRLDHYHIPYRYEAPLNIPDLSYVPDFTIKRPHDGQIIYWEHLGMVTDKKYMQHNTVKLYAYEEYGIVPWRNLILTYGTEDGGINMKIVDAMITGWLL